MTMPGWKALLASCLLIATHTDGKIITARNDFGLSENSPEVADGLDWSQHLCRRDCKDGGVPFTCYYSFKLESYYAMSKACYDCPLNITDCYRPHCVPADGVKRPILVVNRQMPGPSIEVCQGDRVIVDVMNSLIAESTTMHWHGMHQALTPYMDGVPYVSQCPILPDTSFRYEFLATEAGTHFWHSHLGLQRGDGLFGPLIVRVPPSRDWHHELYDIDEHTMLIIDWTHELGLNKFLAHHHKDGDNKSPTLLVNGLGRYKPILTINGTSVDMPTAVFHVKQSQRYRFRLINAEFLNCPIEVSIDNHTLLVVSSDGRDIEPIEAASLVSYAGERFDFVVNASEPVGNYWIRFRGLMDCDERFLSAHQVAVLRYDGAPDEDPDSPVSYNPPPNDVPGARVNALNEGTETNNSVSVPLFRAMDDVNDSYVGEPDHKFFVTYDFHAKDNAVFHRKDLYGFYQVQHKKERLYTPQLNHISLKLLGFPLLSQRDSIDDSQFCNASSVQGCEQDYCSCPHVLRVKLGSLVEIVLVDEGFTFDANHPFHLHGYQFRVLGMERLGSNVTAAEVRRLDAEGRLRRNFDRAPLKDTVTVPDGGYTIIRFRADNPGYWLFHCHIEFHAEIGMALVFKVGEHSDFLPVPENFPRCGSWRSAERTNVRSTERPRKDLTSVETIDAHENEIVEHRGNRTFFAKLLPLILEDLGIASSAYHHGTQLLLFAICLATSIGLWRF